MMPKHFLTQVAAVAVLAMTTMSCASDDASSEQPVEVSSESQEFLVSFDGGSVKVARPEADGSGFTDSNEAPAPGDSGVALFTVNGIEHLSVLAVVPEAAEFQRGDDTLGEVMSIQCGNFQCVALDLKRPETGDGSLTFTLDGDSKSVPVQAGTPGSASAGSGGLA